MRRRAIPGTELMVSELCLGTMTFGTPVGREDAIGLCHAGFDAGINFIDTANSYEGYSRVVGSAGGVAETLIGAALKGRRADAVIATKVGMKIGPEADYEGLSPAHIRREAERSLTRLGIERIDLYYLHRPDPVVPLAETVAAMQGLIDAGKIAHWGISNFSAGQLAELLAVCDAGGWTRPVAVQPAYSLLKRDVEAELLPLCAREPLAVIPYQVLQGGLLTGKYGAAMVPSDSRLAARPEWLGRVDEALFATLAELTTEANARGRTLIAHALLELLAAPAVTSLIVGATRPQQLRDLVAILETAN